MATATSKFVESAPELPPQIIEDVRHAYQALGGGKVAVRSSATAEDASDASMAGQYDTVLDIEGDDALIKAIRQCWMSLHTARSRAYLEQQGIDQATVAMAVVVQRMVDADCAGVLFTAHPQIGHGGEMLLEAYWGLGEALVSGKVQPDSLRLDKVTGRVLAASVCDKDLRPSTAGTSPEHILEESLRRQPCLRGIDVYRLWQMGNKVAQHFGAPQDIEWAICVNEVFVLQTRPITTIGDVTAYEEVLRSTKHNLSNEVKSGRGPWVLHNLAETLPHPTPLTWSVIGKFCTGNGGWGNLYRQAGFDPSPAVCRDGFLELIAGRIYMDTTRALELFSEDYPFSYDIQELQRRPDASQLPPTVPRGSWLARLQAGRRVAAVQKKLRALAVDFDHQLRNVFIPDLLRFVTHARQENLQALPTEQLIERWQKYEHEVLDSFAPRSLMPTLIGQMALAELRSFLSEHCWDEDLDSLSLAISSGGPATTTVVSDSELFEVGQGTRSLEQWLSQYGHRAGNEFDLAAPRWREQPEAVRQMASRLAAGESPLERHRRHVESVDRQIAALRYRLSRIAAREFDRRIALVHRYLPFREDGKHYLMLGYELLRALALEAGRRLEIGADVFFLSREELFDALRVGFAPYHLIELRKAKHQVEIDLPLPRLIDENAVVGLGQSVEAAPVAGTHVAFAVSSGKAVGRAQIVLSPTSAGNLGKGYMLVCPSTDPSWTPLFVNAAGLIVERGGALSHGAVVARELGLPAVVLPGATQLFRDGDELYLDGSSGRVGLVAERVADAEVAHFSDPDNLVIASEWIPPAPGRKDRRTAALRNICAAVWLLFLVAFFWLPSSWVRVPTLSICDLLLWPSVRAFGKPATVALVAATMAFLVLIVQRVFTDNRRLLEAKRRARLLQEQSKAQAPNSPRRAVLLRQATPVTLWTLQAALAPVGLLLGILFLPFVWFAERVDPFVASPPPGSAVQIVARVNGDWREPIRIEAPAPLYVDASTAAERTLPLLRPPLERLLVLLRHPREAASEPWELQTVPDYGREQAANDLEAYLAAGMPTQGITWLLQAPSDANGAFPITVTTEGYPSLNLNVVLGENDPPGPLQISAVAGSPLEEIRVVYPRPKSESIFWQPFARLGSADRGPFISWLARFNVSWLWLYIITYVCVLGVVKRILRVA